MREIKVDISEKDKKGKAFTLFNFRDELVNFMYKKTVADSSRISMRFFVIVFFLSLRINQKSLLMDLFDENIKKIKNLNKVFSTKDKLERGEYAKLIKENELQQVFKYDIFFILVTAVLDSDKVLKDFAEFFSENLKLKNEFLAVIEKHKASLEDFDFDFKTHLIVDDRLDEFGEYHDLSKSVYRTIKMRTSRQIDLSLHRYAEVKTISSRSPIHLTIIQHINPQIVVDLWETYRLGDYVKIVWKTVNDNALISGFAGNVLAQKWLNWKSIDGQKKRKEKKKAKLEFDEAKADKTQIDQLIKLTTVLAESVIKSNEHLQAEIKSLRDYKDQIEADRALTSKQKDEKIRELEEKIKRLENIKVDTEEENI